MPGSDGTRSTPRPPTPSVPLTKLLGRRGLTGTRLLLALATTKASTLRGCTSTSTTATATSATASAASTTAAAASTTSAAASTTSTAATEAPTPGTTPTSTATPCASSTASAVAPAIPSTTLAPLALAVAVFTRSRRSPDLLSANEVDNSSRSNRGEKGDRGTPLKERGSSLYTLATEPPQVAASTQVSASGQVAASCSCRLLSHQTLLWHHRLGHPSLPHLRGMHSRLLVSGLPRSLPPLPPLPAPPCHPYVEGRQRAAPHSSSFPPTTAPLQTLHMDVWGPARVSGQGRESYFLLVADDYARYTTVFPLCSKGEVPDVLIPWIRTI
ncbi:unnamed protein product, partial [Closterium sp. NIES-53]